MGRNIFELMAQTAGQGSGKAAAPTEPQTADYGGYSDYSEPTAPVASSQPAMPPLMAPPPMPRPTANIGDIFNNLRQDAQEMGQGLATMPSFFWSRGYDATHGQPLIRPDDGANLQKMGGMILNEYKQNYADPVMQGRPLDIFKYGAQHPLFFGLDVIPLAKPLGVGKVAGMAGKAVAKTAVGQAAAQAGKTAFGAMIEQAEAAAPKLTGHIKQQVYQAQLGNEYSARMSEYLAQNAQAYGDLRRLKAALPEAEQAALLSAAEGTHPEVLQRGYAALSEGQRAYLDKLREVAAGTAENAKKLGHITDDQIFEATYNPLVKPIMKRKFGTSRNFEDLAPNEQIAMRQLAKRELDRVGVKPIYQARMFEDEVAKVMNNPTAFDKNLLQVAAQRAARAAESGKPLEQGAVKDVKRLAWEKERKAERGAQFHDDSADLAIARDIQVAQAAKLYETMLDHVLKEAKDVASLSPAERAALDAGLLTEWSPRELFQALGKNVTNTAERNGADILQGVPERVVVPTPIAEALERLHSPARPGLLASAYAGAANFARRYILGFNVLLPEVQGAQNLILLGLTQFKGPRNALLSLCSYVLAHDKKVLQHVPPHLVQEMFEAERKGLHPFGPVDKLIDANFARLQGYDKYARSVAAVQYALEISELMPETKPLITGMVKTADAIERLDKVFSNPQRAAEVAKKVLTVLGDYSAATAQKRGILRSTLLWWMWYEHITKFAFYFPANHPYKASLLAHVANISREALQNPNAPEGLNEAGAVATHVQNDQGLQYHVMAGNLNPMTGFFENLAMITAPFDSSAEATANSIVGGSNPLIQLFVACIAKTNPSTGKEFQDPRLLHQNGQQFKPEEFANGKYDAQRPVPNWAELAGRYFLNRPVRAAERIYAKATTGGEPSQFTSVISGEPAPRKAMDLRGEPVRAAGWVDIAVSIMTGINPVAVAPNARQKTEMIQAKRMMQGRRSAFFQGIDLSSYQQPEPSQAGSSEQYDY